MLAVPQKVEKGGWSLIEDSQQPLLREKRDARNTGRRGGAPSSQEGK